jgi:D-3-phosphoglycerate dehydrogenase
MTYKVLISDSVHPVAEEMLRSHDIEVDIYPDKTSDELREIVGSYHGWIVRSGTKVNADLIEAADALQVIGRAGVGVDNIDLEAATRRGVLVMNAPHGNTISTAEHTTSLLLSLARRIPEAYDSLKQGRWERKKFTGNEVFGKTLGIIGIGKIGRNVAERMLAFEMNVIGFDPVLSEDTAERLGIELVSFEELLERSDYITVHTPLNDQTRGMLNRDTLARCKEGVRIINCARGGIVDEQALLEAVKDGHVAGAALDVYSEEPPGEALRPLIVHPHVVTTPHIAASTGEAQRKVAEQITEQVISALQGGSVQSPVNSVAIKMAAKKEVQPYLELADRLGQVAGQLVEGQLRKVSVGCHGEVAQKYAEILTIAAVRGVLANWKNEPVNYVNTPVLAEELGLQIEERRHTGTDDFTNLIEVEIETDAQERSLAGTIIGTDDPRIVRVDQYHFEVRPEGTILFYSNEDRPGMLAAVGNVLAGSDINIGALALGREGGRGELALTAVSVDDDIPDDVREQIAGLDGVRAVRVVHV